MWDQDVQNWQELRLSSPIIIEPGGISRLYGAMWSGNQVRPVRISEDNSHVKAGRVVGESQEGGKNLEDGRTHGAAEAAKEREIMA